MDKLRYEVVFNQGRWVLLGGSTTGELEIIESYKATDTNKQRAYEKLSELRTIEKRRRKDLHRKLIGE